MTSYCSSANPPTTVKVRKSPRTHWTLQKRNRPTLFSSAAGISFKSFTDYWTVAPVQHFHLTLYACKKQYSDSILFPVWCEPEKTASAVWETLWFPKQRKHRTSLFHKFSVFAGITLRCINVCSKYIYIFNTYLNQWFTDDEFSSIKYSSLSLALAMMGFSNWN